MISPTIQEQATDTSGQGKGRWMVVIYNNETNSMDEVMATLIQATGCDFHEAYCEMWEAHTYGKAPVHFAEQTECERVAGMIERIGVETTVCPEWDS